MEQTNNVVKENVSEEGLVSPLGGRGANMGLNEKPEALLNKVCHNSPGMVMGD
jgi:hypothetical protein